MIFWVFYFLVGAVNLGLEFFHHEPMPLLISRILLMPTLMIVWIAQKGLKEDIGKVILAALIFSWLGDIILTFSDKGIVYFASGLVSFLVVHIFYIIAFSKEIQRRRQFSAFGKRPWLVWPFVLVFYLLIQLFWTNLGVMKIPVSIYGGCIITMFAMAVNRIWNVPKPSYILTLVGATCFVLSDSMIGYNRFVESFEQSRLAIMLTYIIGQGCIVGGVLKSEKMP